MLRLGLGLFLIVLPLLELALLVVVARQIGFWTAFAAVLGSGFVGALVVSRQSLTVLRQVLEAAHTGRQPAEAVLGSAITMAAGVLLMVPGFISDGLALILLAPPIRRSIGGWIWRHLLREADAARREEDPSSTAARPTYYTPRDRQRSTGRIIEGEFERLDDKPPQPPSGDPPERP